MNQTERVISEAKQQIVAEVREKLKKAKGVTFVDYKGLTVAQDTALRNDMRANKIEYKVIKNTILRRAFNDLGVTGLDAFLQGTTAVAISGEDAVLPARVAAANAAKYTKMSLKAGYAEGKVLDAAGVVALSRVPAKEVLI
ncbi:MAG: 50S ribosomal protein L10, partial [Clostridiales bacterium]|nr:50S ribosomal protein L10 [Clostridiales bacterium]